LLGFIVNPKSGNGKGAAVWTQLQTLLLQQGIAYKAAVTANTGEAASLTAALLQAHPIETLAAIGGDGTIHEVAAGFWQNGEASRSCRLAVIPAGTGNDFAKAHGIPTHTEQALDLALEAALIRPIDLLLFDQGQVSVNNVGAGFDGMVAKMTNEAGYKKLLNRIGLGKLSYFITMLRVFAGYQPCKAWLTVDGEQHELPFTWLVATTNTPYYGGSMEICPHAVPDDGIADIMVIRSSSRIQLLPIMLSVYKGKHIHHPAVSFYRGQSISLRTEKPLLLQADGEPAGYTPLSLKVMPAALAVIAGTTNKP
jgi:diacylglycerol kinase (ATP)